MITQSYKLNIVPYAEQTVRGMTSPKVPVSQYDKGLRTLVFDLYDGANGRLTLLNGQTTKIYGKKPDANVFEYDMTVSEDKKSVSIVLQEQMAVIAGCVECEVRIFQGVNTVGSANFKLIVEPAPVGADEVYSESEIPEIDNLLYGGTAGQVFTKTPTGAHWADLGTSSDFMLKSEYDPNDDGSVLKADHADDADTVDGHTVARNVLAGEYTNEEIDAALLLKEDKTALKALAYKDNASGNFTPAGSVAAPTFTGAEATIESTFTPAGTVSKPAVNVTPSTTTVNSITDVGTLPSCTHPVLATVVTGEDLAFVWTNGSFDAGTLPTKGADQTVMTGASADLDAAPTFTGTAGTATATYTPAGSNSAPAFTGSEGTVTVS